MPPRRYTCDRSGDRPRILANRYEVVRRLGTGTFGTVFLVKDLMCNGDLKVSKEISLGDLKPDETVDAIREAKLLSRLDHPGIVKFYDSFMDGEFFCIITEYCEGGDLADQIEENQKSGKRFAESNILTWLVQLILAVQYMHSRKVLHRDIKTRNIFLKNNIVKLGDFGISRILMGTTDLASTFVGTPYFMSPEVLKHEGYNSTSDVWSVGCILYELCTHEHAFSGQSLMSVMYKITEGKIPDLPDRYSSKLNDLYKRMLQKNPTDRPSAKEITKIPFISQHITKMVTSVTDYSGPQNWEDTECKEEVEDLAQLLKSKSRLEDLITDSETRWLSTLTPRQMLQVKKEMRANEEARELNELAHEKLKENYARKVAIRTHNHVSHEPAWRGGHGDGEQLRAALTLREMPQTKQDNKNKTLNNNHLSHTSIPKQSHLLTPTIIGSIVSASSDPHRTLNYATYTITPGYKDDRPITPMKNTMVYDVKNSSLDFKDGIPDEATLADTYYSQFNDFVGGNDSSDSDDEVNGDMTLKKGQGDIQNNMTLGKGHTDNVNEMTLSPCHDDPDRDVESFIYCLEGALTNSDNEATIMPEEKDSGTFAPGVRNVKIKNLTDKCERILGREAFLHAYNYLKQARYNSQVDSLDETCIFQGLKKFVPNPADCFLIDQLLFLEEQVKSCNSR